MTKDRTTFYPQKRACIACFGSYSLLIFLVARMQRMKTLRDFSLCGFGASGARDPSRSHDADRKTCKAWMVNFDVHALDALGT